MNPCVDTEAIFRQCICQQCDESFVIMNGEFHPDVQGPMRCPRCLSKAGVEYWRTIQGYSMYQVSNLGRVKSFSCKKNGALLAQWVGNLNRRCVNLMDGRGGQGILKVHALVMDAFVGPRPMGQRYVALDGNWSNLALHNLGFKSPSEIQSAARFDLGRFIKQVNHKQYSLLWKCIVARAVALVKAGALTGREAGRRIGVTESTMSLFVTGRRFPKRIPQLTRHKFLNPGS